MGEMFDSAHNFGIYTKSGKRTIFQIDFSVKRISLIERGKIGKTYEFDNIEQYDSEENLHITIRFRNNTKSLEFDADTAEEKYTICRLLGIILGSDSNTGDDAADNVEATGIQPTLSAKKQILKEGVLDKKGNTKFPTWSRRRLQVCPGEFSYYKPGDEVALNLVQLWENSTIITSNDKNGFTIAVRDRAYHFRVPSEKGINQEMERNKWIEAFQHASRRKRTTFLLLEMSRQQTQDNKRGGMTLPTVPSLEDIETEASYYNENTVKSKTSSSGSEQSSRELFDEFEAINELDEVLEDAQNSRYHRRDIALSVIQKNSPVLSTPTKNRARPPALGNMKTSIKSTDDDVQGIYDMPEPDYSPPSSPEYNGSKSPFEKDNPTTLIQKDRQTSGKYATVIKTNGTTGAKIEPGDMHRRKSGEYTSAIKPTPGAVGVMHKITEPPILRRVKTQNSTEEKDKISPREKRESNEYDDTVQLSVKQIQANIENTYANENADKTATPERLPSPREKTRFPPPPPPSGLRPAPPPPAAARQAPAPPPPPPAPLYTNRQPVRGKLKQVHWTRTPKPLVTNSIWARHADMTPVLNIRLLEDQFSLKERDVPPSQGPKTPPGSKQQLLIDGKRAQNLGIFMSGLKTGANKLLDVLNSVTEDDNFPVEKLTTIRRLQPSEDEIDMYRAYSNKRHELHPVDQFMLELCEIPCLSIRIDICLTLWDFPWQYESTCQLVDQVHAACDELLNSQMLVVVLEYLLAIGNHLNRNWSESHVTPGFQVTSLDKVLDIRGKDTGYTLIHFLVEQLKVSDPGLLQWTETVQMVKKCEQVSVKSVAAESEVLKGDLTKIKKHLKVLKSKSVNSTRQDNKFQQDAQNLTVEYEMKLEKLDRRCGELHNKYRKILTRFGEPLYQRSDQMFAIVAHFSDRFKTAVKEIIMKTVERKPSIS